MYTDLNPELNAVMNINSLGIKDHNQFSSEAGCSSGHGSQDVTLTIVQGQNGEPCIKNKKGQILVTTENGKQSNKYCIVKKKKSMMHNKLYIDFCFQMNTFMEIRLLSEMLLTSIRLEPVKVSRENVKF